MRFWYAYVRAAAVASAVIIAWVVLGAVINTSARKLNWTHISWSMPATVVWFILLTFGFTLLLGGSAHWFLTASGARKRLHYAVAGAVLGVLPALLTYNPSTVWAVLLNG